MQHNESFSIFFGLGIYGSSHTIATTYMEKWVLVIKIFYCHYDKSYAETVRNLSPQRGHYGVPNDSEIH